MEKEGNFIKGFGISFCLSVLALVLNIIIYELSFWQNNCTSLFCTYFFDLFISHVLFVISNLIGIFYFKNEESIKRGMIYGFIFVIILPSFLFLLRQIMD